MSNNLNMQDYDFTYGSVCVQNVSDIKERTWTEVV
jgi:hypothetical protein